ncbi:hypothetical protein L6164_032118 [Bauhinia variegata]|uniref:Uncharacterized protein n=1 Tax=Bauhinia variegata TaxID=167791 RepID=A0ACB9KMS6_BAUVA|nr:hypothetical protein L6164_032118 [Bauhinia variegata]
MAVSFTRTASGATIAGVPSSLSTIVLSMGCSTADLTTIKPSSELVAWIRVSKEHPRFRNQKNWLTMRMLRHSQTCSWEPKTNVRVALRQCISQRGFQLMELPTTRAASSVPMEVVP